MSSASFTPENTLLVDIGGTYIRFYRGNVHELMPDNAAITVYQVADYPTLEDALSHYLAANKLASGKDMALGLSIAAPILSDTITLTNANWTFSLADLQKRLQFAEITALNDFGAVAYGVPALRARHIKRIGPDVPPVADCAIAVLGPGTGLGMASLVPYKNTHIALPGEGPHQTAPAKTQRELDVIHWLRNKYRHVSCERICSGKGLVNIYHALAGLSGHDDAAVAQITPETISTAGMAKSDPIAVEALDMMLGFLGTIAGNHALLVGARGGVYIAGGIPLRLGETFFQSRFRQEFEAKGRFEDYLKAIPTYLIDHPNVGILGLDWHLRQRYRANVNRVR